MKEMYLSSNLKYLRTLSGKTLKQIAKAIDVSDSAISLWENNQRTPNIVDLANLCNYFNISVDDIVYKDLRVDNNVKLDEDHSLDLIAMKEQKKLTQEDKEYLVKLMETINKKNE